MIRLLSSLAKVLYKFNLSAQPLVQESNAGGRP